MNDEAHTAKVVARAVTAAILVAALAIVAMGLWGLAGLGAFGATIVLLLLR